MLLKNLSENIHIRLMSLPNANEAVSVFKNCKEARGYNEKKPTTHTSKCLIFFLHLIALSSPSIGYRSAVFKHVKYVHSVNQMHLFCLLNQNCNEICFRKTIETHFLFSKQNQRI